MPAPKPPGGGHNAWPGNAAARGRTVPATGTGGGGSWGKKRAPGGKPRYTVERESATKITSKPPKGAVRWRGNSLSKAKAVEAALERRHPKRLYGVYSKPKTRKAYTETYHKLKPAEDSPDWKWWKQGNRRASLAYARQHTPGKGYTFTEAGKANGRRIVKSTRARAEDDQINPKTREPYSWSKGDPRSWKQRTRAVAIRRRVAPNGYKLVPNGKGGTRATRRLSPAAKRYVRAAKGR